MMARDCAEKWKQFRRTLHASLPWPVMHPIPRISGQSLPARKLNKPTNELDG
jgi:hypothetical protein